MPTLRVAVDAREAQAGANQYEDAMGRMRDANGRFVKGQSTSQESMRTSRRGAVALGGTFQKLAAAATAAISAFDAFNVIRNFEAAMAELQGVSNATAGELRILQDVAREMGATTKFSATEAAQGLTFLARAGFNVGQAVESLPGVLSLATAANMDLARSADIVSNILSGFRLNIGETQRVVDVLAKTSNNANVNIEQLGLSLGYTAPLSASLGIAIEETAAAIGTLGDNAIQGEKGGTALRSVFAALSKSGDDLQNKLSPLGLTLANVDIKSRGLVAVMRSLRDAGLDVASAMQIFGQEGATGALILAESADRVAELTAKNKEAAGEAERMAEIMGNTLQGKLKGLRSALEELYLQIGEGGITGALRGAVDTVTDFLRVLAGNQEAIDEAGLGLKVMAAATNLFAGGLAGIWEVAKRVFSALGQWAEQVSNAMGSEGLLGSIEEGITAIVNGTVTIEDIANGIVATFAKVQALIQAYFVEPVLRAIEGLRIAWDGLGTFMEAAIKSPLGAIAQAMASLVNSLLGSIRLLIDGLSSLVGFLSDDLAAAVGKASEGLAGLEANVQGVADKIAGDSAEKLKSGIAQIGVGINQAASLVAPSLADMEARWQSFGDKVAGINEWLSIKVQDRIKRDLDAEKEKQDILFKLKEQEQQKIIDQEEAAAQAKIERERTRAEAQAQSALEQLRKQFMAEQELLAIQRDERRNIVAEARAMDLVTEEERNTLLQEIERRHQSELTKIQEEEQKKRLQTQARTWQANLTMAQQSLQALQQLLVAAGNENLAESKAFGIAQAVISTAIGIARAMELGWPAAIPAMALAAATGAAQIAAITSASKGSGKVPSTQGGGGGAGGAGGGGGAVGQSAATSQPPVSNRPAISIEIADLDDDGIYTGKTVREIMNRINEQVEDGAGGPGFGGSSTLNQGALT